MLTFNLRLQVVSRFEVMFENTSVPFLQGFSRIQPSKLVPPSLSTHHPTFAVSWASHEISGGSGNKGRWKNLFHYLGASTWISGLNISDNQWIHLSRKGSYTHTHTYTHLQLKLLCTHPWPHFPPSFLEETTLLTCVYQSHHWLLTIKHHLYVIAFTT